MLINEVIHDLKIRFFIFFGFVSFGAILQSIKNAQLSSDKSKKIDGLRKLKIVEDIIPF
jgi:hypothetical protein